MFVVATLSRAGEMKGALTLSESLVAMDLIWFTSVAIGNNRSDMRVLSRTSRSTASTVSNDPMLSKEPQ